MNKRGFYSLVSIFIWFFLIILAISLMVVRNVPDADLKNISSSLVWDKNGTFRETGEKSDNVIVSITYGFVDFFVDSAFKLSKEAVIFVSNNPSLRDINPKILIYAVVLAVVSPIIWPVFLLCVSITLIILEFIKNRREKRGLLKLKEKKQ